jgi:hypothetical protein
MAARDIVSESIEVVENLKNSSSTALRACHEGRPCVLRVSH